MTIAGAGFSPELLERLREREEVSGLEVWDERLELTLRPGAATGPLVALLVNGGATVEEVRKEKASLEETFLELVRAKEAGQ